MCKKALFTIASKNYISFGRTLLNSIKKYNDDIDLYLVLADECDDYFDKRQEDFSVIEAKELNIDNFEQMAFKYNIIEFNTSLKPFFIQYLFDNGYEKIIYLDPDMMVFNSIEFIYDLLTDYSIVLTPHLTKPISTNERIYPLENMFLFVGTFNLGFIGISDRPDSRSILKWWKLKCSIECFMDYHQSGLFVDQKWCSLFPGFSDKVFVLRHQGCNMAIWNLQEREIKNSLINDYFPLIFYHFSGYDPNRSDCISPKQSIYTFHNRPDLEEIFSEYNNSVFSYDYSETKHWPYRYGFFNNNNTINQIARHLYPSVENLYPHPFSSEKGSYYALLRKKKLLKPQKPNDSYPTFLSAQRIKNKYNSFLMAVFKILLKIVGPILYLRLMNFVRKNINVKEQGFLLK